MNIVAKSSGGAIVVCLRIRCPIASFIYLGAYCNERAVLMLKTGLIVRCPAALRERERERDGERAMSLTVTVTSSIAEVLALTVVTNRTSSKAE